MTDAYDIPLDKIDVTQADLYQSDTIGGYFKRLRDEAPVHYCPQSRFGPYWSITRYADIMAVDTNNRVFSSDAESGGIQMTDFPKGLERKNFINMDPPEHDVHRKIISPIVRPSNLVNFESIIRDHATEILDDLPRGETIDWVDHVSIELTTRMLATLFNFPFEDRRLLTFWSEVATAELVPGTEIDTEQKRVKALQTCLDYFNDLYKKRADSEPQSDLVSMLAHSSLEMDQQEFLSTLILLIIGGNDTTRNSITGGLLALHDHPEQWTMLKRDPGLISTMVPEIIRWQTPLTMMRRTTTEQTEIAGVEIPAGEKIVMWYLSGNRDERMITDPDQFVINRESPRRHLSFGFGIHRCVGNRLAEMQLRVLWEEILLRKLDIEIVGPAERTLSHVVRGFSPLPVRVN